MSDIEGRMYHAETVSTHYYKTDLYVIKYAYIVRNKQDVLKWKCVLLPIHSQSNGQLIKQAQTIAKKLSLVLPKGIVEPVRRSIRREQSR